MTIIALLALAAAQPAVPVQPVTVPVPRASVVATVQVRIISAARVTIGAVPTKGQPHVRNGLIEFE
jgi:hypothetical protein